MSGWTAFRQSSSHGLARQGTMQARECTEVRPKGVHRSLQTEIVIKRGQLRPQRNVEQAMLTQRAAETDIGKDRGRSHFFTSPRGRGSEDRLFSEQGELSETMDIPSVF